VDPEEIGLRPDIDISVDAILPLIKPRPLVGLLPLLYGSFKKVTYPFVNNQKY